MEERRIIKRYPNRRLYDKTTSQYITLSDIKKLVLENIKFKIIDNETNDDLTNYILLQIISEQEIGGVPIFTTEALQNIIRFYGNPMQTTMSDMLEKWFSVIGRGPLKEGQGDNPLAWFTDLAQENFVAWQKGVADYFEKNTSTKTKTKRKKPS